MKKIKNIYSAIKAWDKKNTTMHSGIYLNIFLLAAVVFAANINKAVADLAAM